LIFADDNQSLEIIIILTGVSQTETYFPIRLAACITFIVVVRHGGDFWSAGLEILENLEKDGKGITRKITM